jgi:hypothetical protein
MGVMLFRCAGNRTAPDAKTDFCPASSRPRRISALQRCGDNFCSTARTSLARIDFHPSVNFSVQWVEEGYEIPVDSSRYRIRHVFGDRISGNG